jgi:hypothetical protein
MIGTADDRDYPKLCFVTKPGASACDTRAVFELIERRKNRRE